MNTDSDDTSGAQKCLPALEDYYECLHHRKEVGSLRSLSLPASLLRCSEFLTLGSADTD